MIDMTKQSDLLVAAEQADNNVRRLAAYRAKVEKKCKDCGRDSQQHTACRQCQNERQYAMQEEANNYFA